MELTRPPRNLKVDECVLLARGGQAELQRLRAKLFDVIASEALVRRALGIEAPAGTGLLVPTQIDEMSN